MHISARMHIKLPWRSLCKKCWHMPNTVPREAHIIHGHDVMYIRLLISRLQALLPSTNSRNSVQQSTSTPEPSKQPFYLDSGRHPRTWVRNLHNPHPAWKQLIEFTDRMHSTIGQGQGLALAKAQGDMTRYLQPTVESQRRVCRRRQSIPWME